MEKKYSRKLDLAATKLYQALEFAQQLRFILNKITTITTTMMILLLLVLLLLVVPMIIMMTVMLGGWPSSSTATTDVWLLLDAILIRSLLFAKSFRGVKIFLFVGVQLL